VYLSRFNLALESLLDETFKVFCLLMLYSSLELFGVLEKWWHQVLISIRDVHMSNGQCSKQVGIQSSGKNNVLSVRDVHMSTSSRFIPVIFRVFFGLVSCYCMVVLSFNINNRAT